MIVAAATAATDPLQRTLLLLELGPDAAAPSNAKDLAIDLATTTLPWALLQNDGHPISVGRFGADGQSFATGSSDGSAKACLGAKPPSTFATAAGGTVSVARSEAARLLVSGLEPHRRGVIPRPPAGEPASRLLNLFDGTLNDGLPVVVQPAGY